VSGTFVSPHRLKHVIHSVNDRLTVDKVDIAEHVRRWFVSGHALPINLEVMAMTLNADNSLVRSETLDSHCSFDLGCLADFDIQSDGSLLHEEQHGGKKPGNEVQICFEHRGRHRC